jgi:hypothetical protein
MHSYKLSMQGSAPPAFGVSAVVRLEPSRQGEALPLGTGFILAPWPWAVITAAHVLVGCDRVEATLGGETFVAEGFSRAFGAPAPHEELAVLRLPYSLPLTRELHPGAPPNHGDQVDAELCGFPASAPGPSVVTIGARRLHELLVWNPGGVGGMSGGPVCVGDRVIGVYVGVGYGNAAADDHVALALDASAIGALRDLERASLNPHATCQTAE